MSRYGTGTGGGTPCDECEEDGAFAALRDYEGRSETLSSYATKKLPQGDISDGVDKTGVSEGGGGAKVVNMPACKVFQARALQG